MSNVKVKTKTEDDGILKKGKRSSSYFFLLRIGSAGQEEYQIFCYAKRPTEGPLIKPSPASYLPLFAAYTDA